MPGDLSPRRRAPSAALVAVLAAGLLLAAAAAGAASWREVERLFRDARYDEAARAAAALGAGPRPGPEAVWWSVRLQTDPDALLRAARGALARGDLPAPLRARLAEEIAGVEYARGRWTAALEALAEARRLRNAPLAGEAAIWADAAAAAAAGTDAAAGAAPVVPARSSGAPPGPAAGATGPWTLQLGAFSDEARARQFLARWRDALPGLRLETDRAPAGTPLYRVRLGGWPDRDAAARAADALRRERGLAAIVVESAARP